MSDEEVESFEITDYDLETEFNPNKFRKSFSKHQQTYGIWADESEEEDDGRRNSKRSSGVKTNAYKGPVAFISAGVQKPVDEVPNAEENDNDTVADLPVTDSSSEDEVQLQIPARFGQGGRKITSFNTSMIAGLRSKNSGMGKGLDMYGMGAKLAMKMGYQPGKGLGKDLQGISAPIETQMRKGRGAIGLYGREAKTKPGEDIVENKAKPAQPKPATGSKAEQKWQKQSNKKVEYHYITAEEVLDQKHLRTVRPDAGHLAKVKVIDLTGPEQRILSGYHAISGQQKPTDDWEADLGSEENKELDVEVKKITMTKVQSSFEMPELLHNLYLLKDTCEENIIRNDNKSRHAANRKIEIDEEEIKLIKIIENEESIIKNLENVITEVQTLTETVNLDMDSAFMSLGRLQRDHPEEWELYQLYNLISPLAIEFLKQKVQIWNPLEAPQWPLEMFTTWASLLNNHREQLGIILWEAWMPSIRQASTYWNVKEPECMLKLLDYWRLLLPAWIMQNIHEQLILPRVIQAVDDWDPISDEIPIHSWIHPWLPHLGSMLEMVYPVIRRKLSNALGEWDPSDFSAKLILTPWLNVFTKGAMDTFVIKNIVPKLQLVLQEVVMTPMLQVQEPWKWVVDWVNIVPTKSIVTLLEGFFFPRWLQFLMGWLSQSPNYDDVSQWYSWWRSIFPETLSGDATIREYFQKALEMIGTAIQNPSQSLDFSYILSRPTVQNTQSPQPPSNSSGGAMTAEMMADALRITSQVPHGFKDLVQMKCEELGLLFVPLPNRNYEGKQVYRVGSVFVYINANVIYIQKDNSGWTPTSLQQLIQVASLSL